MSYLYRYEARAIQTYVLGTGKLKEIAGASALVESLAADATARAQKAGATPHAGAAGGGTFTFPTAAALTGFANEWMLECALQRPGLLLVHGWVDLPSGGEVTPQRWAELRSRIDADRQRREVGDPPASPLVARAPRTGRPAVGRTKDSDAKRLMVDAVAVSHERAYDAERDELFERMLPPDLAKGPNRRIPMENLEEFGEEYLAVLHADGNGVGKLFAESSNLGRYRSLTEAVSMCTTKAIQDATKELIDQNAFEQRKIPIRPVVIGGDDITVILRARDAVPFAARFLETFARLTKENVVLGERGGLTASAGIAIVKPGFPFRLAHRLAHELCDETKRRCREDSSVVPPPSALLFHRVTSASLRSLEEILRDELSARAESSADRTLLGGPWLVGGEGRSSIERLSQLAHALEACSRGSIREWLRLARTNYQLANAHWRRMVDVAGLRHDPEWGALGDVFTALGCDPGSPWRSSASASGQQVSTPLLDALVWARISGGAPLLWKESAS